jgi:hypothetical protein
MISLQLKYDNQCQAMPLFRVHWQQLAVKLGPDRLKKGRAAIFCFVWLRRGGNGRRGGLKILNIDVGKFFAIISTPLESIS